MLIELRSLTSIRPYDQNPRINDDAVDALVASSLARLGIATENYARFDAQTCKVTALAMYLGSTQTPLLGGQVYRSGF